MTTRVIDLLLPKGTHASRPASAPKGALYPCSTHGLIYQWDGTTWNTWQAGVIPGGTSGQALVKSSSTDYDYGWATPAGSGSSRSVEDPSDTSWGTALTYDVEFDTDGSTLPSGWAWVNQGSAAYEQKFGKGILTCPGTATDNVVSIVRAIPSESTWTATLRIDVAATDATGHVAGMVLRDSTSGRLFLLGQRFGKTYAGFYFASSTSFNSSAFSSMSPAAPPYRFVRIKKNSATSYDLLGSSDGVAWQTISSAVNLSTYVASISHIGIGVYTTSSQAVVAAAAWFRIR